MVTGPFLPYGFQYSTEVQVNGQKKFRERQERLKCFNFQMTKTKVERLSQSRALRWVTDLLKEVWNKVKGEEEASSSTWLPKVTFLSVATAEKEMLERRKFAGKFSSVFVACSVTHFLQVETVHFLLLLLLLSLMFLLLLLLLLLSLMFLLLLLLLLLPLLSLL